MEKPKVAVSRIHKLEGEGNPKAFCDISLFDAFVVKGLKVVEGKEGLFVGMPSETGKDGKWYNTFMPLTREAREELERVVLEAYAG